MSVRVDKSGVMTAERTIRQSGNSTVVSIPPAMLDHMDLESGDEVILSKDVQDGELVIKMPEDADSEPNAVVEADSDIDNAGEAE